MAQRTECVSRVSDHTRGGAHLCDSSTWQIGRGRGVVAARQTKDILGYLRKLQASLGYETHSHRTKQHSAHDLSLTYLDSSWGAGALCKIKTEAAGGAPVLSIGRHSGIKMSWPNLVTQPLTPGEKSA